MDWLIIPLAAVTGSAFLIGRAIAQGVPDEVAPNRRRLSIAQDALLIAAAVIGASALLPRWAAGAIVALLIVTRVALPERWSPTAIGAFSIGIAASDAAILAGVAIIAIVANLLAGALAKSWRGAMVAAAAQPVGAVLVALLISLR